MPPRKNTKFWIEKCISQDERETIIQAFTCQFCAWHGIETTSIADQMRAVHEAFLLVDGSS
jgi:hypothetical protein